MTGPLTWVLVCISVHFAQKRGTGKGRVLRDGATLFGGFQFSISSPIFIWFMYSNVKLKLYPP
jgi:hypothetical protein